MLRGACLVAAASVVCVAVSATCSVWVAARQPPRAGASACAGFPGQGTPKTAVAFDAVALSGPRFGREPFVPGRMLVLRYRAGAGPRIVRVDTGTELLGEGRYVADLAELNFEVGGVYRVFPFSNRRSTRIGRDELLRPSPCDTRSIPLPASVRSGPGRVVRSPARVRWRARLLRGPFGLRCLAVARLPARGGGRRECEQVARPSVAVTGVWHSLRGKGALVAAQAPRLRSMTVASPLGIHTVPAPPGSRIAAIAYDGALERRSVYLTLRFAGGHERAVVPYAGSF